MSTQKLLYSPKEKVFFKMVTCLNWTYQIWLTLISLRVNYLKMSVLFFINWLDSQLIQKYLLDFSWKKIINLKQPYEQKFVYYLNQVFLKIPNFVWCFRYDYWNSIDDEFILILFHLELIRYLKCLLPIYIYQKQLSFRNSL